VKLRLLLIPLVLGLGLLVAGCGGRKTETVTVTVTAGSTTSTAPTTTEPSAETTAAVTELQQVMTDLGYYDGPIDGVYGDATTEGVKKMQTDLGVTADGVYGAETGKSIVIELQTELQTYGYYDGELDGAYGQATQDAVKKLQTDLGVTADGKFGPETADAFTKAVEDGTITPKS
jgi:peptidoglycan hydrolase-like protein with peptidoglycan-binding domain